MASEQAIPEKTQEKTHGDKLDHVVDSVLDKGTGLTQDSSARSGKGNKPEPQEEPLK